MGRAKAFPIRRHIHVPPYSHYPDCQTLSDKLSIPIIAAGGIGDGRGVTAALNLGQALSRLALPEIPEVKKETALTRAFSGRLGRSIETNYVRWRNSPEAPKPRSYLIQKSLTESHLGGAGMSSHDLPTVAKLLKGHGRIAHHLLL